MTVLVDALCNANALLVPILVPALVIAIKESRHENQAK